MLPNLPSNARALLAPVTLTMTRPSDRPTPYTPEPDGCLVPPLLALGIVLWTVYVSAWAWTFLP